MDGIAKLRGVGNWAYIQRNQFQRQGDNVDKVFVFKMSEVVLEVVWIWFVGCNQLGTLKTRG